MIFPASVTRQCEDLAHLLGTACIPYFRGETDPNREKSVHSAYRAALQSDAVFAMQAMDLAAESKSESTVSAHGGRSVFAIPLVGIDGQQWYAIGRSNEPPTDSSRKLIKVAGEAIRRQHKIDYQERAILDAECELEKNASERFWLRQLNAQRAIRKKSVGQQSCHAIESLRNLIDAEAIAIWVCADGKCNNHGLESMISGDLNWTLDDFRFLLIQTATPASGDSVVLNEIEIQLCNGLLHSCVVVPIGDSEPIGFVIAINEKKSRKSVHLTNGSVGFSTRDAELLHEVAGHLSADGYSNAYLLESEQLVLGTLRAMSNAIEARDPYTHGHSERVGSVGYQIAQCLRLSEISCQEIYLAGVLHDIGKIGIPDHVLLKPGKLESDEFAIIQKHPEIGHRILEELGKLRFALPGVLYHHERIDGRGYPHQLFGEEIPLMSRILAVADAYDAMTSSRVYRNAMGQQRAIEILRSGTGTQWDSEVVEACLEFISDLSSIEDIEGMESTLRMPTDWPQLSQALRVLQL